MGSGINKMEENSFLAKNKVVREFDAHYGRENEGDALCREIERLEKLIEIKDKFIEEITSIPMVCCNLDRYFDDKRSAIEDYKEELEKFEEGEKDGLE